MRVWTIYYIHMLIRSLMACACLYELFYLPFFLFLVNGVLTVNAATTVVIAVALFAFCHMFEEVSAVVTQATNCELVKWGEYARQ